MVAIRCDCFAPGHTLRLRVAVVCIADPTHGAAATEQPGDRKRAEEEPARRVDIDPRPAAEELSGVRFTKPGTLPLPQRYLYQHRSTATARDEAEDADVDSQNLLHGDFSPRTPSH